MLKSHVTYGSSIPKRGSVSHITKLCVRRQAILSQVQFHIAKIYRRSQAFISRDHFVIELKILKEGTSLNIST